MRPSPGLAWLLAAALLGGCAQVPPVPVDQYYRLPAGEVRDGSARGWLGEVVLIPTLRSAGIFQERALLYTEDRGGLVLKRRHYHHWVDAPPRLLQAGLARRLRTAGAGKLVLTGADSLPDVTVAGRILAFEHHLPAEEAGEARIGLELEVRRRGAPNPQWLRIYQAAVVPTDPSMPAVAAAFGQALDRITAELIADLRSRGA